MKKNILFYILLLLSLSCKKDKTTWFSDYNLPLIKGNINFSQFVNDSTLSINTNKSYQLILERNLYSIKLDTLIKIKDTVFTKYIKPNITINVIPGTEFSNQVNEYSFYLNGAKVKKIRFKKGKIKIKITSPLNTKITYSLEIPKAYKNGVPFNKKVTIEPGTKKNKSVKLVEVDISGFEIDLRGILSNSFNKLETKISAKIEDSANPISITPNDTVYFDINFNNLIPDYATGYFGEFSFEDNTSLSIPYMENITSGHINFNEINFDFIIENGIKAIAQAKIFNVKSKNINTQNNIELNHDIINQNININPATNTWSNIQSSKYIINFNNNNSNIKPFIENLPNTLSLNYNIKFNPYGNISGGTDAFYPKSKLNLKLKANMPLAFSTDSLCYIDTSAFDIKQNFNNTHIYSGELILDYKNLFPFSGKIILYFLDENNKSLFSLIPNDIINASKDDLTSIGVVSIPISNEKIQKINHANKIVFKFIFDTPEYPNMVTIYDYYNLEFNLKSNLRASIKI